MLDRYRHSQSLGVMKFCNISATEKLPWGDRESEKAKSALGLIFSDGFS